MSDDIKILLEDQGTIDVLIDETKETKIDIGQGGGTTNYNVLTNKPSINGVTLVGDKTSKEIQVQDLMDEITPQEIDQILYGG